ncbi:UNVERIFIED_ORG: hypothetical protein ABIB52_002564 [Arthrobacter sp. UYCu721]
MVWNFLRGLADAVRSSDSDRPIDDDNPYRAKPGIYWHWQCECGGHSRGGDSFKADAEQNAQRHQWNKGLPHPMPEVYSTNSA